MDKLKRIIAFLGGLFLPMIVLLIIGAVIFNEDGAETTIIPTWFFFFTFIFSIAIGVLSVRKFCPPPKIPTGVEPLRSQNEQTGREAESVSVCDDNSQKSKKRHRAAEMAKEPKGLQERSYLFNNRCKLQLVAGLLDLPQGSICKATYNPNRIVFSASGQEFTLEASKMLDVSVMNPVEIQKQYVSSIGGAVAGAMLLGPLGAVLGGSASKKTVRNKSKYLIFTYLSGQETKYIIFDVTSNPSAGSSIKSTYRYLKKNEKLKVEL